MLTVLKKIAAPLALLLALLVFSAAAIAAAPPPGSSQPDLCCAADAAPPAPPPVSEGECFDCNCLSCSAVLFHHTTPIDASLRDPDAPQWLLATVHPSDHIRSIDYPPETA
ncbi:MAG: hypothetical protein C0617_03500 [Desulfuromonas sp.]|uniref:hypothetical protein n=1 Tax=Desulfuromonas sp. TaxID=892 RepID=UPI000CC629D6|nr:hypothetical protein [Desulfuromonas sp.]PLX85574.1 MAG: hypothetical protein C0617_03500 [Desulfuromonas sp.]